MSAATPPSLALPDSLQSALQRFYQSWGHQAVIAGGTVWFDGGSFSSISIPTAISPVIEDRQVRSLLNQTRKLAAIYRTHQPDGIPVALYTMRDKSYALGHLQRQFRQQVRSASTRLEVRECTWEEWKTAARRCDHETLARRTPRLRGDHPLLTASGREQVVTAARAVPSLRLHACLWDEEIVAYLVHVTLGTICEGLMSHRCDDSHNSAARHAAHLLYYSFTQSAITRPEIEMVTVGRQSLPANHSLARFKCHAGYQAESYSLRIRLHPLLAPLLENRPVSALLNRLRRHLAPRFPQLHNLEVLERAYSPAEFGGEAPRA